MPDQSQNQNPRTVDAPQPDGRHRRYVPANSPLLIYEQLRDYGVLFSRNHLRRLVKVGEFPAPVQLGGRSIAWRREEIEAYVEALTPKEGAKAKSEEVKNAPAQSS